MNIDSHSIPTLFSQGRVSGIDPEKIAEVSPLRSLPGQEHDSADVLSLTGVSTEGMNHQEETKNTYDDPRLQSKEMQRAAIEAKREQAVIEEIKQLSMRDREVRAHEQAHMAMGGQYAGSASYEFQSGPNGVRYAVGGEVPISTGPEATPQQTLIKARVVRAAALAPAEPSPQDRKVAAMATQMEVRARSDIAQAEKEEASSAVEEKAEDKEVKQKEVTGTSDISGQIQDEPDKNVDVQKSTNIRELFTLSGQRSGDLLSEHA